MCDNGGCNPLPHPSPRQSSPYGPEWLVAELSKAAGPDDALGDLSMGVYSLLDSSSDNDALQNEVRRQRYSFKTGLCVMSGQYWLDSMKSFYFLIAALFIMV